MYTNKIEYLLQILIDLAKHAAGSQENYILSREIAERQNIPPKYVPQLMAILTKRGWVDSVRGAGGGVKLAVDPASITIQDVVDATGDNFFVKVCLSEESSCQRKSTCPLFPVWQKAQESLRNIMKSTTIAELASE